MSISADASSSTLYFCEETTWGTIETSPPWLGIRQTGNGLQPTFNKAVSDEITPTASIGDVIPTSGGAEGDVNFEPSYGTWQDTVLEHVLRGSFDVFGVLSASNSANQMSFEKIVPKEGSSYYFRYAGGVVNTLTLTLDATATTPITSTANIMAKTESTGEAILSGATYTDANSNPVMSMPELRELYVDIAGTPLTSCYTSLNLSISNNLRLQQGKCTATSTYPDLNAKGVGYGRREITLDVGYYFGGLDFVDMFANNTSGSFSWIITDGTRGYKFTLPAVKILESSVPIEGNNSDVIQNMTVQALYDSSEGTDFIAEKIGYIDGGYKLTGTVTVPSGGVLGTYYWDGTTQENGENVYYSVDGNYAIWYDGSAETVVTDLDQVGEAVPSDIWFDITGTDPAGSWGAVDGTGTVTGATYDPTA